MLRCLLLCITCLFLTEAHANPGDAANPLYQLQGNTQPLGYCQLSVTTAAKLSSCTNGIPKGVSYALVCNEATAARWRDDGTAPTTSVGMVLGSGTATAPICGAFWTNFSALTFIAESGTATLDISFYR